MTRGFTLVETMVAVAIVAITTTGPLYAVQQGVVASYVSRDRLIASSLAQEGTEYVHGVRDGNYLHNLANPSSPRSWLHGIDGTGNTANCTGGVSCVVDASQNTIATCSGTCDPLKISSTYIYNQQMANASNINTRFTRTVKLTSVSATEMKVSVTVSWITARVTYSVTVVENLHNWL